MKIACLLLALLCSPQQADDFVHVPDASREQLLPGVRLVRQDQDVVIPDAKVELLMSGVKLLSPMTVHVPDAKPELLIRGVKLITPVQEKLSSVLGEESTDHENAAEPLPTKRAAGFPLIERDSQIYLLLQSPTIRQGMEIVKIQEIELDDLKSKFDSRLRKLEAIFVDAAPGEQPALIRKAFDEVNAYEEGVKQILEPQWDNLQKSLFRSFLEENGLVAALLNPGIGRKIGLSSEQQTELKEDLKGISEKVDKELEEIQRKIVREVISKLNREQRDAICAAAGVREIEEIDTGNFLLFLSRLRQATSSGCCGNLLIDIKK